eukprot:scaffold1795_cov140-Isochrysis_galbana.AAC.6
MPVQAGTKNSCEGFARDAHLSEGSAVHLEEVYNIIKAADPASPIRMCTCAKDRAAAKARKSARTERAKAPPPHGRRIPRPPRPRPRRSIRPRGPGLCGWGGEFFGFVGKICFQSFQWCQRVI